MCWQAPFHRHPTTLQFKKQSCGLNKVRVSHTWPHGLNPLPFKRPVFPGEGQSQKEARQPSLGEQWGPLTESSTPLSRTRWEDLRLPPGQRIKHPFSIVFTQGWIATGKADGAWLYIHEALLVCSLHWEFNSDSKPYDPWARSAHLSSTQEP